MSERNVKVLLQAIIDSIDTIYSYIHNVTFEEVREDSKTRDAVLMQLMVLGETASRAPESFRKVLPDIEWGRIIRSRNIIDHEYHGINHEIIWRIVTIYLPGLKQSLTQKLQQL